MDWKKTFNRGQWIIHGIFIVIILMVLGSTIFALRLNHLQSTEEERALKINSLINYLKSDKSFEKLGKYLSLTESQKANDKISELGSKVAEAEEVLDIKASKDLGLSIRNFHKLISSNSGMSNPADALKVLSQKVNQLLSVALNQNYKNIKAVSEKMKERLSELNPRNAGSSIQVSYLKSDLVKLEKLIQSSSLAEGEKTGLVDRINSMMEEIDLLLSLNGHSRDLRAHVNQASIALGQWVIDVEKRSVDLKGTRGLKQNQLVIFLAAVAAFLITSWMGLAYFFRWQRIRIGEQVESEVRSVIEKGILSDQRFMMDHYSESTRDEIIKILDGLKIKLNLGTMLHDGLPFAGCLVDNNFRLTWFNHLFLEQFYLSEEEVRADTFNWDFLRDYLNLTEDPVHQGLVNKMAGIYPVKIKQDEYTPAQPFEMYVTPIAVNREDRVMVFFYPLISAKEAISEQVDLASGTMMKFIELWNEDKLGEDEIKMMEKDFKNNEILDLYKMLESLYERLEGEKQEYIRTIRMLEKESSETHSLFEKIGEIEAARKGLIRKEFHLAGELKESFINSLNKSESLLQINRIVLQQNDEYKTEAIKMQQSSMEILKKNKEIMEIISQLESIRVDYKKLKLELLEIKAKLITINGSLMSQLPPLDDHQQKLANRNKDELARLDFNVVTLDKKLGQLDVLLTKLNMMNEKTQVEQTNFNFQTSQKDHEMRDTLLDIHRSLSSEEGKIIESFKSLHQLMKEDLSHNHEVQIISSAHEDAASLSS